MKQLSDELKQHSKSLRESYIKKSIDLLKANDEETLPDINSDSKLGTPRGLMMLQVCVFLFLLSNFYLY